MEVASSSSKAMLAISVACLFPDKAHDNKLNIYSISFKNLAYSSIVDTPLDLEVLRFFKGAVMQHEEMKRDHFDQSFYLSEPFSQKQLKVSN